MKRMMYLSILVFWLSSGLSAMESCKSEVDMLIEQLGEKIQLLNLFCDEISSKEDISVDEEAVVKMFRAAEASFPDNNNFIYAYIEALKKKGIKGITLNKDGDLKALTLEEFEFGRKIEKLFKQRGVKIDEKAILYFIENKEYLSEDVEKYLKKVADMAAEENKGIIYSDAKNIKGVIPVANDHAGFSDRKKTIFKEVREIKEKLADHGNSIEFLKKEISSGKEKAKKHDTELDKHWTSIESLRKEMSSHADEIKKKAEEHNSRLADHGNSIEFLKKEVTSGKNEHKSDISGLQYRIKALENNLEQERKSILFSLGGFHLTKRDVFTFVVGGVVTIFLNRRISRLASSVQTSNAVTSNRVNDNFKTIENSFNAATRGMIQYLDARPGTTAPAAVETLKGAIISKLK